MSIGEERVRVNFNVAGSSEVDEVKLTTAALIDGMEELKHNAPEAARCAALAQTHYEVAAMWAVKALTGEMV